MFRLLAVLTALCTVLTAGSGLALALGSSAAKGHVVLGLVTVVLVLALAHLAYWKYHKA